MSMPKALLGLFVITGMSGCMDHIHFSGDKEFLKITTVLGEIDQVERCIIVGVDDPPYGDNGPNGDSEFYTCNKLLTLSESAQEYKEYRERIQEEVLIDGVSVDLELGLPEGTYRQVN